MPHTDEIDEGILRIVAEAEVVDIRVEGLGDITLLPFLQVEDQQALAVALIAVAGHREPSDVAAVGRELGILVVANIEVFALFLANRIDALVFHRLGRVDAELWIFGIGIIRQVDAFLAQVPVSVDGAFFCLQVEEEDIGVGGNGVLYTLLHTAGVGNLLRVGTPGELLNASEGSHRTLVGHTFENVLCFADCAVSSDVCHEGMHDALYIVIPMAVVQIGDEAAGCLRQVIGILLDAAVIGNGLQQNDLLVVG